MYELIEGVYLKHLYFMHNTKRSANCIAKKQNTQYTYMILCVYVEFCLDINASSFFLR